MNAAGYNLLLTVLFIIYIFAHCGRSHFVMNFVSVKFLLLFFWIKVLVKMANFPTRTLVKPGLYPRANYLVCR
jgi:formate/nitrite transporter FocA (FNT family)